MRLRLSATISEMNVMLPTWRCSSRQGCARIAALARAGSRELSVIEGRQASPSSTPCDREGEAKVRQNDEPE